MILLNFFGVLWKKLSNEEFDQYCSKIIKKLCKSVADDLDFYDFEDDLTRGGTLNEVN